MDNGLDLSPTDLNTDRGHLLIKDYLHTMFQVWSFCCKAFLSYQLHKVRETNMTLTLTFELLPWISIWIVNLIWIIYLSWTIYLSSLKLLGRSFLELSVARGVGDQHDLWPWPTDLNINKDHLLTKDYLPTKFEASWAKTSWVISWEKNMTFELDLWPTWPLTYWPKHQQGFTKFEASGAQLSWVISCTRCGRPTWPLTLTF